MSTTKIVYKAIKMNTIKKTGSPIDRYLKMKVAKIMILSTGWHMTVSVVFSSPKLMMIDLISYEIQVHRKT
jgi:hypothetical protein